MLLLDGLEQNSDKAFDELRPLIPDYDLPFERPVHRPHPKDFPEDKQL